MNAQDVTLLARTNARNDRRIFGIKRADRRSHFYAVGKTGTGKSSLFEQMILQDIANGEGLALIDPHGDLVERVAGLIPASRRGDLYFLNLPDPAGPLRFNPLKSVPLGQHGFVAGSLLDVFKKMWEDYWGARLEHVLRNALLALLEIPDSSLADVLSLLDDDRFRRAAMNHVTNEQVRRFWLHEWEHQSARYRLDTAAPIQNKIGALLTDPLLRRFLTEPGEYLDLRRLMDSRKILLINLSKGRIGEDSAALVGSLLVAQIGSTAMSRADQPEHERSDFFLYLDEFQMFANRSLATMLAELRKYRVNLVLANQYTSQLEPAVSDAVLGNVGTFFVFRLGPDDAALFAKQFAPRFAPLDFMNLPNYSAYVRLLIDGQTSIPFSAGTLAPGCRTASN